jgi:tripartite-type tricarboxylate transporter receptor subunit TctC
MTSSIRRRVLSMALSRALSLSALGVAATLSLVAPASAQTFPNKPIMLVVPFVAGGTTDILGRIVAEALGKRLGQTVLVDNRGGAGGNLGAALVAKAEPDGYTLLMGYNGTNAINPSLYPKLSWDPLNSFSPISLVARVNNVVVVNPALPIHTLPQLVAYAKAHPGKVNYGSAGAGSIFHLAGEMLSQQTGVQMAHVPYKGAAPALTDLMGGQIDLMFTTIPNALQHIKTGRLRALGVTGEQRSPLFPDLPTAAEAGYKGMVVDSWFGIFAPQGLTPAVQTKLNQTLRAVLADPDVVRRMKEQGAEPRASSPTELQALLQTDLKSWKAVVMAAKVSLD